MEIQTDINWPTQYTFTDFVKALGYVKETSMINEIERMTTFIDMLGNETHTNEKLRLPDQYANIRYFQSFIEKVDTVREKMISEIFNNITLSITKLKEFVMRIASTNEELNKLIEEEGDQVKSKFMQDIRLAERTLVGLYNYNKDDAKKTTDRYNKIVYILKCLIWNNKFDISNVQDEGKTLGDIESKLLIVKKITDDLPSHDKEQLKTILRDLLVSTVAMFIVRRGNIFFRGGPKVYHLSYYCKEIKINRLKELIVFDRDHFDGVVPDSTEHKQILAKLNFDELTTRLFNKYIIDIVMY